MSRSAFESVGDGTPVDDAERVPRERATRARNDVNPVRLGCNNPRADSEPEPPRWCETTRAAVEQQHVEVAVPW